MNINNAARVEREAFFSKGDYILTNNTQSMAYSIDNDEKDLNIKKYSPIRTNLWDGYGDTSVKIEERPYGKTQNLYYDNIIFSSFSKNDSITNKTKELFEKKKIGTIISRFYTDEPYTPNDTTQSASTNDYNLSHGRNLLTHKTEHNGEPDIINGYKNPYCRVWTHHHTYSKLRSHLIRPFITKDEEGKDQTVTGENINTWDNFDNYNYVTRDSYSTLDINQKGEIEAVVVGERRDDWGWRRKGAENYKYSVLNNRTGFLNIAPKYNEGKKIHPKDCMFSIENLAWQGYDPYSFERALSWEQRGPFGGRIMWFPPYGLRFNEDTSVQWNEHSFIGRGENVFTYTNTSRSGTLEFMMVVDHPSILDYVTWDEKVEVTDTDIMRFFAGCNSGDKGSSQKYLQAFAKPTPLTDEYMQIEQPAPPEDTPTPEPPSPIEVPQDEEVKISFYAFFPNNYSGYFDTDGKVDPIAYLLYGKGAQWKCDDNDVTQSQVLPISFEKVIEGLEVDKYCGNGYEMKDSGSDIDKQNDNKNYIIGTSLYGTQTYKPNINKKWYYRIDGEYVGGIKYNEIKNTFGQTLTNTFSYSDNQSFNLNCNAEEVKTAMGIGENSDEEIYSLAEVAYVLCKDNDLKGLINENSDENFISENKRIEKLKEMLDGGENSIYTLSKVETYGYANNHGANSNNKVNKDRNDFLAQQRAATLLKWFKENYNGSGEIENNAKTDVINVNEANGDKDRASSKIAKKWRSAKLTIFLKKAQIETVGESQQNSQGQDVEEPLGYSRYTGFIKTEQKGVFEGKEVDLYINMNLNVNKPWEDKSWNKFWFINPYNEEMVLYENKEKIEENTKNEETEKKEEKKNHLRYDQEYHFFKELSNSNPDVFEKLVDKLQYFDPAFHSMTPEGFMGRLNFLHQCTRQGDTVGCSDFNGHTANNLAFGRPPFCILRLGDFYYQKIVIRNINITYDPLVLDLNQEGVGVVPLIANVTISFNFIGGGDLTGPVRRLQNAMSFNYYANGRLYDNRADRVKRKGVDEKAMGAMGHNGVDFAESRFHHVRMAEE